MIKNECGHAYKLLDHAECLWCENCVEKLVERLSKKPGVTEEWIEEKAREFIVTANVAIQTPEAYKLQLKICSDFIRLLIEEITSSQEVDKGDR